MDEALSQIRQREQVPSLKDKLQQSLDIIGDYIRPVFEPRRALALVAASLLVLFSAVWFYNVRIQGFTPIIVASRGDVQIYHQKQDRWVTAQPGARIYADDSIRLGKYAQVDIDIRNLYEMRIKQNSEVSFERLARNYNSGTDITVNAGKIMVDTKERFKGSTMKITTPASKTTVLGTTFMIDVNPIQAGTTWVGVLKGKVMVEGIEVPRDKLGLNKVIVEEGKGTYVRPGEVPTIPEIFSDKEWEAMDELYRIGDLPQVALLIGTGPDRVEELMQPCMIYIYDARPRKLSPEFDTVVKDIKEAVRRNDLALHRKAARKFKLVVEKYPDPKYNVQFYLFLGAYNFFLRDYQQSLNLFNRIIDDFSDSKLVSLAMCAKAYVYEKGLKQKEKARDIYNKILTYYPYTPEAKYAEKALERM
jgi:hypothetical protein